MKILHIEPNSLGVPLIHFDSVSGLFEISGKSTFCDSHALYKPVLEWLDNYFQNPNDYTKFDIRLDSFNSVTTKVLLSVFKKFDEISKTNRVEIFFHFEKDDEFMNEIVDDYNHILKNYKIQAIEE